MDDLENLLNLHGEVFPMDSGYWVKFEAYQIEPSKTIPHGIRYSLTLHDKNNHRVIGYDNAHSFKSSKKYGANKETYDHIHKQMDIVAYEFESASQLLEDFWKSVDYYMENN
ncbi:toxin-antitoxin system TumE family protein [Sulfurimonas sp. ST-27]|uniref:toxin-antitoxin system TumE family protein n=1 Tax=unclassified Sulfurimonas TaxID=2623549 RepID=UPI003AB8EB2B